MHITIASPSGGYDKECTPEEEKKIKQEWVKNAAEQLAREKAEQIEREEAEKGMNTLCEGLPPAEAAALKKLLNV